MPELPEQSNHRIGVWWVGLEFSDGTRAWGNIVGPDEYAARRSATMHYKHKTILEIRTEHVCNLGFKDATNQV